MRMFWLLVLLLSTLGCESADQEAPTSAGGQNSDSELDSPDLTSAMPKTDIVDQRTVQAGQLEKLRADLKIEPDYDSEKPGYLLVVFGSTKHLPVWIVVDTEFVYIDRNSNGDLTDEGERIAVSEKHEINRPSSSFTEFRRYLLGNIPESIDHPEYRDIVIDQFRGVTDRFLTATPDEVRWKALIKKHPHLNGNISVKIDDFQQNAGPKFAASTEKASIVNFDGPMFLFDSDHGMDQESDVASASVLHSYQFRLGTPGSIPSAFAYTKAPKPPEMNAVLKNLDGDDTQGEVELTFCGADYCTSVRLPSRRDANSILVSVSVAPFAGRQIEPMETTIITSGNQSLPSEDK